MFQFYYPKLFSSFVVPSFPPAPGERQDGDENERKDEGLEHEAMAWYSIASHSNTVQWQRFMCRTPSHWLWLTFTLALALALLPTGNGALALRIDYFRDAAKARCARGSSSQVPGLRMAK